MANGLDLASLIQAAQLGRSLNPEVMQQQALGNQLALQLQQLQAQRLQQELADPQRAARDALILENIRSGGTLGLSVLDEGQQALGPLLQSTGINRLAYSPASADAANKRILAQMFAKEKGLQEIRSQFDPDATVMVDGVPVLAEKMPDGTYRPRETVIPARPTGQFESLTIPQAPAPAPIDQSSLQSLIEGSGGALGAPTNLLGGMTLPTSREIIEPERRSFAEAMPRFGSIRTYTPNARLDLAKDMGASGQPLDASILNTPELVAAYNAAKGTGGVYAADQRRGVLQLTKAFQDDPYIAYAIEAESALDTVLNGIAANNSTGDIAAINAFQGGMIDPKATVREGDVELIQKSAALFQRFQNYIPKLLAGAVLTPEQRKDMQKMAEQIYDLRARNANDVGVKKFKTLAPKFRISLDDFGREFPSIQDMRTRGKVVREPSTGTPPSAAPAQQRRLSKDSLGLYP